LSKILHIWWSKCDCGKVYKCHSGKTPCCNVLARLVKDEYGTEYDNDWFESQKRKEAFEKDEITLFDIDEEIEGLPF